MKREIEIRRERRRRESSEKGMKKRKKEKREEQQQIITRIIIRIITLDRMLGSRGDGTHTLTGPRCRDVFSLLSERDLSHLLLV